MKRLTRLEKRRLARKMLVEAAKDMDVSLVQFAEMVSNRDDEALAALAAVRDDVLGDVSLLHALDIEEIMLIIQQIAEILILLLPLFI